VSERMAEALNGVDGVRLGVLFGSHARHVARPDSDVDLALRLDDDSAERRRVVERTIRRSLPDRRIDFVYLDDAPPQLRFEMARSGRVLIERVPYSWADFCAKAMMDWWDWAPTARLIHRAAAARSRGEHGST
jgi:predicted nucleotidyltransferase